VTGTTQHNCGAEGQKQEYQAIFESKSLSIFIMLNHKKRKNNCNYFLKLRACLTAIFPRFLTAQWKM
jgi:hypothetical protein